MSGISPLLAFFDATGTSDSGLTANTTAFQDVTYSWNFGDAGASGTGKWAYGSNARGNSKNTATGGIAAHLYVVPDGSGDTGYTATVTATDGTNTAQCSLAVTANDASGPSGFPGSATTCYYNATVGSGCPAGAAHVSTTSFSSIGNTLSGKRLLFKCGDTFAAGGQTTKGTKFRVGAYGSCIGTQINRPIFNDANGGSHITVGIGTSADSDFAFSDLDLEGNGKNASPAINLGSGVYPSQGTFSNIRSNGNSATFYNFNASQIGLLEIQMPNMGNAQTIPVFINDSENQCVNGSSAYNCGGTPNYQNVNYWAIMGNEFNGIGATFSSEAVEVVRISACRLCIISNNIFENALNGGAVLKLHSGNPNSIADGAWIGQYTELVEISDNIFTGKSGAQLVEIAPQNAVTDERLRNIVFERNLLDGTAGGSGKLLASVQNGTFRDNVFNTTNTTGTDLSLQIARRGIEWNSTSGAPHISSEPQYNEVFNNSCYSLSRSNGCIGFDGKNFQSPGNNGWAKNNLYYNPAGGTTVSNIGTGNAISNNTLAVTGNPLFINAGGSFNLLSDFMPATKFLGATDVPVYFDALGTRWPPIWELGAVHP